MPNTNPQTTTWAEFENKIEIAKHMTTPRLTTIDQNALEMAKASYQKLLAFTKVRMRVLHGSESALKTVVFHKAKG